MMHQQRLRVDVLREQERDWACRSVAVTDLSAPKRRHVGAGEGVRVRVCGRRVGAGDGVRARIQRVRAPTFSCLAVEPGRSPR